MNGRAALITAIIVASLTAIFTVGVIFPVTAVIPAVMFFVFLIYAFVVEILDP